MTSVAFVLLREGTSDDGLIPHLRSLLVAAGCNEAVGDSRRYTGSVREKLERLADEGSVIDLVFVHRDADQNDHTARLGEISKAHEDHLDQFPNLIPVIPVQETEAWLLVDEAQIRSVVGRPNGKAPLTLPKIKHLEATTSPKEVLDEALLAASETKGRKLQQERRRLSDRKRTLLERLDIHGQVQNLPAWQRLVADIETFAKGVTSDDGGTEVVEYPLS